MVSKRPPLLGYNHNVRHAGRLFHVQTEDSGPARPVITTHIFFEGTILSTARTQYQADEPEAVVQKKMQDQHKSMLKRVRDGAFDHMQELQSRSPTGASGDAHGAVEVNAPKELPPDPPTSRMAGSAAKPVAPAAKPAPAPAPAASISEERTAEIVRPVEAKPAPAVVATSPVAPPPSPGPPPAPPPGSLAERLRRGAAKPAPPPPRVTSPDVAKPAPAAVVEFVADSDDDDEPSVTIEAAEPSPAEDVLLSSETPLPAARPLGSMRDSLVPEEEATMRMRASQMPVPPPAAPPPVPTPQPPPARAPASAARPQTTRAIPSALPRPRPSAEGVIVSRYPLQPSRRAPADPLRVTLINARPTVPAPLALSVPAVPHLDEGGLDAAVISYLSRDLRR